MKGLDNLTDIEILLSLKDSIKMALNNSQTFITEEILNICVIDSIFEKDDKFTNEYFSIHQAGCNILLHNDKFNQIEIHEMLTSQLDNLNNDSMKEIKIFLAGLIAQKVIYDELKIFKVEEFSPIMKILYIMLFLTKN